MIENSWPGVLCQHSHCEASRSLRTSVAMAYCHQGYSSKCRSVPLSKMESMSMFLLHCGCVASFCDSEKFCAAGLSLSHGSEILVFPKLLGAGEASHWIDKVTATPYSEAKLAMPHCALKAKRVPHYLKQVQVLLPCFQTFRPFRT